jgi:hypothetical protein
MFIVLYSSVQEWQTHSSPGEENLYGSGQHGTRYGSGNWTSASDFLGGYQGLQPEMHPLSRYGDRA